MGWLSSVRAWVQARAEPQIPPPGRNGRLAGTVRVNEATAMRASAVWACLRLRANLISTMPVDVYRRIGGVQVQAPTPPVLVTPDGRVDVMEWLYATQVDLDRAGNCFGVITERNALGLPARIELAPLEAVGVRPANPSDPTDRRLKYTIGGTEYDEEQIWHERQNVLPGLAVGLSPVAHAAWSVGAYLSAQEFALDWFGNSAMPAVQLRNKERAVPPDVAEQAKARYQASVTPGSVFVTGNDWELSPINAVSAQGQYLELMQHGVTDIARFFDCPSDLIDAAVSGQSVTYANMTQRNLQLLIMHVGPAVMRRETALSRLVPAARYVKLNRAALLAMDPATRAETLKVRLDSRQICPSEARALEDLPPFTPEQLAEFDRVYGAPRTTPTEAKS